MGKAKPMTKMKMENLNVGKFVLVLAIPISIFYFFIFNRNAPDHVFYLIVNVLASCGAATITASLVVFAIGIIYEVFKICRPLLNWLFK
jgi:hypothetical protein